MSERTLLPVIITARDAPGLAVRLSQALSVLLLRLGVPEVHVERELVEMSDFAFGPTRNRRLLGSLNDFMFRLSVYVEEHPSRSTIDAALWLADTPCGAIGYGFPDQLTRKLFGVVHSE